MTTDEPLVLAATEGSIARITLNRPRAINALNTEMFQGVGDALAAAQHSGATAVFLDGAGERGFCGGGDIKEISGGGARDVFRLEYRLDYAVHTSKPPVVGIMDGVTMGGGIGLAGHASHRIVTERSRLAMPEVRLGISPDVGGHLLLANAPGRLGEYLAITAGEMTAGDAIALGFADAYVPSERITELREALAAGDDLDETIARVSEAAPESMVLGMRVWFDAIADEALGIRGSRDVIDDPVAAARRLVEALEASDHLDAQRTAKIVRGMCPLSLAVTLHQLARTRAEGLDLAGVLEDDYRILSRLATRPNFAEGVRAQVIDKDRNPQWIPSTLEALELSEVLEVLAPSAPGEDTLGLE